MAESDGQIAKYLEKFKSNDFETKVDAITNLQAAFESGEPLTEIDEVIAALKAGLRTPNQHVSTASLSAIAALFPILVTNVDESHAYSPADAAVLRHALTAFLPAGGIVDRLGDNREKARDKAREALVAAGSAVFRHNPAAASVKGKESTKGPETPMAIFERNLRDLGIGSKAPRVREQSILVLVTLRRENPQFPIRPYLPHLVSTLEDSDGGVRDCAKASVIELFTAASVSDAARADLKKEMTKKGVRKGIVESILGQLLTTSGSMDALSDEASSAPPSTLGLTRRPTATTLASQGPSSRTVSLASGQDESVPPPSNNASDEVAPVYIASAKDLEHEFAVMMPHFEGKENEHNWQPRDRAITRLRGMIKGEVHIRFSDTFLAGLRSGMMERSLKTLVSLRTIVALNTCAFYSELVRVLGQGYEIFAELTLTMLIKMGASTKKIVANQTQGAVKEIIVNNGCSPRIILPLLWNGIQEKNVQTRGQIILHVQTLVETQAARWKTVIETSGSLEMLENVIKKGLTDANGGIRDTARIVFWAFDKIWRERANVISASLDATGRKQLDKACPAGQQISAAPAASEPKKNSVAAAIAASRAKAKQIAADPPTLRHAATAHASTFASQSRRPSSPVTSPTTRNAAGPRVVSPSSSIRKATTYTRSATSPGSSPSNIRSSSKTNDSISPPSSPLATSPSHRRQISSSHIPAPTPPLSPGKFRSSLSTRSISPPGPQLTTQTRRASGVFSTSSKSPGRPISQSNALAFSPQPSSDDDSLLRVRGPSSDTDSNDSMQMASFSQAMDEPPAHRHILSAAALTPSTTPLKVPGPVIEDALRARAEQAESAAERLLEELVEPEVTPNGDLHLSPSASAIPHANGRLSAKPQNTSVAPASYSNPAPPITPFTRHNALLKQAAMLQDSPALTRTTPRIVDMLKENKHESEWWLKRVALLQQGQQTKPINEQKNELLSSISALETGTADIQVLKALVLLCHRNPVTDDELPSPPLTPSRNPLPLDVSNQSAKVDLWEHGTAFDKLLIALFRFLETKQDEETLELGLIVAWEMLENQQLYLEGRESELLSLLFHVRYANKQTISEACNTIRDAFTARVDPIYGLTTMHSSLKKFLSEPVPPYGSQESHTLSYAFGLLAIGKFILRLPREILEEELPRLQSTLAQGLNDANLLVRESAAAAITAAQLVLRDETYLFTLLRNLSEEKKNLLTYLFDKHGARGVVEGVTTPGGPSQGGLERLTKEMSRLDKRTSTPARVIASA